jgi:hypothetical protein
MKYIRVKWIDSLPNEPVALLSELDDDRYETRKLEIFGDGSVGRASADASDDRTLLGELPVPSIDEINSDPQFQAVEITQSEFEAAWCAHA